MDRRLMFRVPSTVDHLDDDTQVSDCNHRQTNRCHARNRIGCVNHEPERPVVERLRVHDTVHSVVGRDIQQNEPDRPSQRHIGYDRDHTCRTRKNVSSLYVKQYTGPLTSYILIDVAVVAIATWA